MPLIFSFWHYQIAAGRKARPVWAIVTSRGAILGWAVNKRHAVNEMGRYDESQHGALSLVRICPNV